MSPCPDERALVRVSLGQRTPEELTQLEAHLDTCADCRRVVAAAAADDTPPQGRPTLRQGEVLGRYTIDHLLGLGGMGVVYAAQDTSLGRRVAIKLLRAGPDGGNTARLQREARVMGQLSHPNLVPIFEFGEWDQGPFLVMELVDGESFTDWRRGRSLATVAGALLDAGRALATAHAAGVVHRDFKPGNLLVGRDGRVRVTDFGLARETVESATASASMLETQAGAVLGTPAWMSPEQLAGEPVDARSDQFSYCVTLAEALGGRRPFAGESLETLSARMRGAPDLRGVPLRYRATLRRGLSPRREDRYGSMPELLRDLERAGRRPAQLATGGVLVVALLIATVLGITGAREAETEVVVATRSLEAGTVLDESMIALRRTPSRVVTPSYVRPDALRFIMGQKVVVPVWKGDAVLWSNFETLAPARSISPDVER